MKRAEANTSSGLKFTSFISRWLSIHDGMNVCIDVTSAFAVIFFPYAASHILKRLHKFGRSWSILPISWGAWCSPNRPGEPFPSFIFAIQVDRQIIVAGHTYMERVYSSKFRCEITGMESSPSNLTAPLPIQRCNIFFISFATQIHLHAK